MQQAFQHPQLFASLRDQEPTVLNLNDESVRWVEENRHRYPNVKGNLMLVPQICQEMINEVQAKTGKVWSYGGWLEDRSKLWAGSDIVDKDKRSIHVGVDFNVPQGTQIAIPRKSRIIRLDREVGPTTWGHAAILEPIEDVKGNEVDPNDNEEFLILVAHLARDTRWGIDNLMRMKSGYILDRDEPFAVAGGPQDNGGWFPHFHVQAISRQRYQAIFRTKGLEGLPGYCRPEEVDDAKMHYPNPLPLLQRSTVTV